MEISMKILIPKLSDFFAETCYGRALIIKMRSSVGCHSRKRSTAGILPKSEERFRTSRNDRIEKRSSWVIIRSFLPSLPNPESFRDSSAKREWGRFSNNEVLLKHFPI